jgi:16S rRNA (cytosine1402-N4)-methyltransferase
MQIDTVMRGFSWRFDAPLDMRMSNDGVTAAEFIENSTVAELAKVLRDFGDVKKSGVIARAMKSALPCTTFGLRDLIYNPKDIAPVFQALRISVNDEIGEIKRTLAGVPDLLAPGGICICITFHSLEDRLVKSIFKSWTTPLGDPKMPQIPVGFSSLKTFRPNDAELESNPRSRSSHLRAVQKIAIKT